MAGKKMVITVDVETGNIEKVTDETGGPAASGPITDLKVGHKSGDKAVVHIPDHTFVRTHSSPGCIWYFANGQWYRVCN